MTTHFPQPAVLYGAIPVEHDGAHCRTLFKSPCHEVWVSDELVEDLGWTYDTSPLPAEAVKYLAAEAKRRGL
jgi:hypothetical protein